MKQEKIGLIVLLAFAALIAGQQMGLFTIGVSSAGTCAWNVQTSLSQAQMQKLGCATSSGSKIVKYQFSINPPGESTYYQLLANNAGASFSCQGNSIGLTVLNKDWWFMTKTGTYTLRLHAEGTGGTVDETNTLNMPSSCTTNPSLTTCAFDTPLVNVPCTCRGTYYATKGSICPSQGSVGPTVQPPTPTVTIIPTVVPTSTPAPTVIQPTSVPTVEPTYSPTATPYVASGGSSCKNSTGLGFCEFDDNTIYAILLIVGGLLVGAILLTGKKR